MVVSNYGGVASVVCVVGQPYQSDGSVVRCSHAGCNIPRSLEVTSEAGLRQSKLTTSCLPHMSSRGQAFILQRSQMIGFMHAMIDQGIDDLVNRNLRSHVLPADMTRLRGRGYQIYLAFLRLLLIRQMHARRLIMADIAGVVQGSELPPASAAYARL